MIAKYNKIMSVSLQKNMEYKFNFVTTIICSFIPFGVNSLIWFSISDYSASAYGYSLNEMVTYYFIMMLVSNIVQCDIAWQMGEDIRSGGINQYLLKPCRYINYLFFEDLPRRFVFIICGALPIVVLYYFIHDMLTFQISPFVLVCFVLSLIIGYIINFLLYYILGLSAFYLSQINGIIRAYAIFVSILSGKVFPLSLLPGIIGKIVMITPFQYTGFVSVNIMQSKYQSQDMLMVLAGGVLWILILYLIGQYLWKVGNKKYSAFGG